MKKEIAFLGILVLIFIINAAGQTTSDSVRQYKLEEIKVSANRIQNFSIGTKIATIDSNLLRRYQAENMADVFSQNNLLFAKLNGSGGLATTSIRGMDAAHTVLLWNGFNINSPMNNSVDLALVPATIANDVKLQLGGAGALWGSGAIGGAIHLNNKPSFNKGISAQIANTIGSFGKYTQTYSVEISKEKFVFTTKFYWAKAENNYTYFSPSSLTDVQQTNSKTWQNGLISEGHYKFNPKWMMNVRYWYQWNDRQVPSTIYAIGRTFQKDETHRISNEWQYSGRKMQLNIRNGVFIDQIIFGHQLGLYYFPNKSIMHIAEVESTIPLIGKHTLNLGINNTYAVATAKTLPNHPFQNRLSMFATYKFSAFQNKLRTAISGRELIYAGVFTPFTPSLGIELDIIPSLFILRSSVSRVYRVPTLNDYFWNDRNDQGNPNLLPELGWSSDVGLSTSSLSVSGTGISYAASLTYFYNDLTNRILWQQNTNGLLTPVNIDEVEAQGLEFSAKMKYKRGAFFAEIGISGDYTSSVIVRTNKINELGKQLHYVPFNKAHGHITLGYKKWELHYLQSYTGFRYTNTDNINYLPAFNTANVALSYHFIPYKGFTISANVKINNIGNAYYEVLATVPMPPRNYSLGVVFNFNQPNKPNQLTYEN